MVCEIKFLFANRILPHFPHCWELFCAKNFYSSGLHAQKILLLAFNLIPEQFCGLQNCIIQILNGYYKKLDKTYVLSYNKFVFRASKHVNDFFCRLFRGYDVNRRDRCGRRRRLFLQQKVLKGVRHVNCIFCSFWHWRGFCAD